MKLIDRLSEIAFRYWKSVWTDREKRAKSHDVLIRWIGRKKTEKLLKKYSSKQKQKEAAVSRPNYTKVRLKLPNQIWKGFDCLKEEEVNISDCKTDPLDNDSDFWKLGFATESISSRAYCNLNIRRCHKLEYLIAGN